MREKMISAGEKKKSWGGEKAGERMKSTGGAAKAPPEAGRQETLRRDMPEKGKRPERSGAEGVRNREKEAETAEEGFRRLAFGDIRGAVRLLYSEPGEITGQDAQDLDLFTVSELKRGKDGQLEMKFYDRLKALQCLLEAENSRKDEKSRPLYEALRESARLLAEKSEIAETESVRSWEKEGKRREN